MKRSGSLTRRTELKRKAPLRRTGRLRNVAPDRAPLNRVYDKWKRGYLKRHPKCAVLPTEDSIEPHHIIGGGNKKRALVVEAAILPVSRAGHEIVQYEPKEKQLARKLLAAPDEFNLEEVNRLCAPKDCPNPPKRFELKNLTPYLALVDPR